MIGYNEQDIKSDYDAGYSIDIISKRYKKSQEKDFENKISAKKAYQEICKVIYNYIMERGYI